MHENITKLSKSLVTIDNMYIYDIVQYIHIST